MNKKTVIITNSAETFSANTLRMRTASAREYQMRFDQSLGERGLLWAEDNKLVITSQPVNADFLNHIQTTMGYQQINALSPAKTSLNLSRDVWEDQALFKKIVDYCGNDEINLIPYTTTRDFLVLAERLKDQKVKIQLPESVNAEQLWIRDYLDSKHGFRIFTQSLAKDLNILRSPRWFVCRSCAEAAEAVRWFLERSINVVVKASLGAGGEGLSIFKSEDYHQGAMSEILNILEENPYLDHDLLLVEEFITVDRSIAGGSPSVDVSIAPSAGRGKVKVDCLSAQILQENGEFIGVEAGAQIIPAALEIAIRRDSLCLGQAVARMGYVGPFDIDLIIGQDEQVYMVEFNMRRNGGSHAFDAVNYLYGPDYADQIVVLTANKSVTELKSLSYDELYTCLRDLVYPMGNSKTGIILTNISLLNYGSFGYIILAPDKTTAHLMKQEISKRLQSLS